TAQDKKKVELKGYGKIVTNLEKRFRNIERKKNISTAVAFGFLGFFGALWCPFYPWWMVMIIALITGAIGYRFPFIALIFVSFVAIGSTAFQTAEFGLLFMIFALIVTLCSLFNWKFGYLSFLTVFLSTFGISFLVPVFSIFLFSLFTSITVTVLSGLFLSIVTATGNVINLSFIVSPYATEKNSITTFSRVPGDQIFSPTSYFNAFGSIRDIDGAAMTSFIKDYMTSMVPIMQILIWVLMVLVVYLIKKKIESRSTGQKVFIYSFTAGGILLAATIGGMFLADFKTDIIFSWKYILVYVLVFPVLMLAINLGLILRGAYSEFYTDKKTVGVGTRISDMMSFRKSSFENVGGLMGVKSEITDSMIGPLLRPEMSKKYGVVPPKGMILFGPPGCGKTLLMRVIATELKVEMIGVKCSDVMSKWYGESENLINDLFKIAREKQPCLLFLDEIDAIAKRRDFYSADDVTPRLLSIMLSEMDGMDEFAGIIIIAATNKPELVDPALLRPGRFDKVMYVPPPGPRDRVEILKIHLKGKPTRGKINVREIAELTDGYSGADLANLCRECATQAMKRALSTKKKTSITMDDFHDMIDILKPSISKKMQKDYIELQSHYERKVHKRIGEGIGLTKKSGRGEGERSYRVSRYDGGKKDDEGWDDDYDEEEEDDYDEPENGWEEEDLRGKRRYGGGRNDVDDDWD
ncbi:MAG: AAA family ATPase, partial [Candidatus Thermoplasmatota archaeon]|nr:AAA family ATPase [Candidatus Thermoplasmatota archaeon]